MSTEYIERRDDCTNRLIAVAVEAARNVQEAARTGASTETQMN